MKTDKEAVLNELRRRHGWVEASNLAGVFGVSPRTIRNYVAQINAGCLVPPIKSSHRGYLLDENALGHSGAQNVPEEVSPSERVNFIIRKLIRSHEGVDFFDLANELFIGESTLENDLRRVRKLIRNFELQVVRMRNTVVVEGKEVRKRRLLNHLLNLENHGRFIAFANAEVFARDSRFAEIHGRIVAILRECALKVDDYGLNNIFLHLWVTIERIRQGRTIQEDVSPERLRGTKAFAAALKLKELIGKVCGVSFSEAELYYLVLTVSGNSRLPELSSTAAGDLREYIDDRFVSITRNAVRKLEETWYLKPFDEDFIMKLALHVQSLCQRSRDNVYVKNPLKEATKTAWPLVYDMAVFVANELRDHGKIDVNEDEIAFIAFHLGSCLENDRKSGNRVSCVFVYPDYRGMYQGPLAHIEEAFRDDLAVLKVLSAKDLAEPLPSCDLVVSAMDATFPVPFVRVSLFPTPHEMEELRSRIAALKATRKSDAMSSLLRRFIDRRLFKKEFHARDEFGIIERLCDECRELGLCDANFKDGVLERETLSSTSFENGVAVPHSLKHNAFCSFLSVVLNEKSMQWGSRSVNVVVLIGINREDRTAFREIFDELIAILSESSNVRRLLGCSNYDDFIDTLTSLMGQ